MFEWTFLGFDVSSVDSSFRWEKNNLIRQCHCNKGGLSLVCVYCKSVTLWFISSYFLFVFQLLKSLTVVSSPVFNFWIDLLPRSPQTEKCGGQILFHKIVIIRYTIFSENLFFSLHQSDIVLLLLYVFNEIHGFIILFQCFVWCNHFTVFKLSWSVYRCMDTLMKELGFNSWGLNLDSETFFHQLNTSYLLSPCQWVPMNPNQVSVCLIWQRRWIVAISRQEFS